MTAKEFFIKEWGGGFDKVKFYDHRNGTLLEGTMEELFETMEQYKAFDLGVVSGNEVALIKPLRNFIRSKHLSSEWEKFLEDYQQNQ